MKIVKKISKILEMKKNFINEKKKIQIIKIDKIVTL